MIIKNPLNGSHKESPWTCGSQQKCVIATMHFWSFCLFKPNSIENYWTNKKVLLLTETYNFFYQSINTISQSTHAYVELFITRNSTNNHVFFAPGLVLDYQLLTNRHPNPLKLFCTYKFEWYFDILKENSLKNEWFCHASEIRKTFKMMTCSDGHYNVFPLEKKKMT